MCTFFFWRILLTCLLFSSALFSWEISKEEAELIGKRIYANECGGKIEKLVWWNDGEHFASLGIGHFIWYPADQKGPFEETFPSLLLFLSENGVEIPAWLKNVTSCPWSSKEEYLDRKQEAKKTELQTLLAHCISCQTLFIAKRFQQVLPQLLLGLDEAQKNHVSRQIERLSRSHQGKYALLDYLNFKGKGVLESERYQGQGWGLKQVLEQMVDSEKDPLSSFIETAKALLKQRVQNAPPERNEGQWLPGWLARIDSYALKS